MRAIIVAAAGFLMMEPITAATHRWVMHGLLRRLHQSHHRPAVRRLEANDAFPVMFAAIVCAGLWVGFHVDALADLVALGIGITSYGVVYAIVHDGYIHGRLRLFGSHRFAVLDRLADAHRVHHLYSRAPYGMLWPIVPDDLRERAARTARDPLGERIAALPRT
jgi:beta-carotene 3-hydroxylase